MTAQTALAQDALYLYPYGNSGQDLQHFKTSHKSITSQMYGNAAIYINVN